MKNKITVLKCYGCIHNMVVEDVVSLFGVDRMSVVVAVGRSTYELIKHFLPYDYVFVMGDVSVANNHRQYSLDDIIAQGKVL